MFSVCMCRCPISKKLLIHCQDNSETLVSCLRPYLPSALQGGGPVEWRGSPQHFLQTLHLLCAGVQSYWSQGIGPSSRTHWQTHCQRVERQINCQVVKLQSENVHVVIHRYMRLPYPLSPPCPFPSIIVLSLHLGPTWSSHCQIRCHFMVSQHFCSYKTTFQARRLLRARTYHALCSQMLSDLL